MDNSLLAGQGGGTLVAVSCVVFEDPFVDRLRPINLARPTFAITCGAFSLKDLLTSLKLSVHYHVRPHLRGIMERDSLPAPDDLQGPVLFVNAALVPDLKTISRLDELVKRGEPFLALNDQRVTAAFSQTGLAGELAERGSAELQSHILEQTRSNIIDDEFPILNYTFDIIRLHPQLLPSHLEYLVRRQDFETMGEGVYVGQGVDIAENVVFNAENGPIVIGDEVRIRPFSYVEGPVRIGNRSLIIDHASIKHGTVLGHTVKAGGEIEDAIIEPYSNKQHHGFLGHAYVGSWVNLGAGTSNSDLKNTYGEIKVDVEGKSISTDMQFLGCVIGDFTKTAINTSILTGKMVGVASFLYGFVTRNVPSFTNFAHSFGQITEVSVDVAIKTQTRAAGRRGVAMSPADTLLMQELFELTRAERQLSSEQVVL